MTEPIPGSYWGAPEAGLKGNQVFASGATPLHSLLHEAAHYLCMPPDRRFGLDTNAGGPELEECAVCYLQICLADLFPGVTRDQLMGDMDTWGYSFRLGSTRAWFEQDSEDARRALIDWGLVDAAGRFSNTLRAA